MSVTIPAVEGPGEEEIDAAERQLGCRLPIAYREFVRKHDGATPQANTFEIPGNQSCVRCFVPLVEAAVLRIQIDGFPAYGVPVAEDGCGNYVWLDPNSAAIFFWDHEVDEPPAPIADDIDQFLASLQPFDPAWVRLAPGQVLSAWIDPDFKSRFE